MNGQDTAEVLTRLDEWRRATGTADDAAGLVREFSADGTECRIVFADLAGRPEDAIDGLILAEQDRARSGGYTLEWKLYGHDLPANLGTRLTAAGFEPEDVEQVLVLPVNETSVQAFDRSGHEVRPVKDVGELAGYAEVSRQIGRKNAEDERRQLARILQEQPQTMSVHIGYAEGRPVSGGRIYFQPGSPFGELAGGRTVTTHRRQGFFTAVVASRLEEARDRGCEFLITDALPTSEPILAARGFQAITSTQPYVFDPED